MFTTLIVQPIFNLLVLIYALLPGHNFGLSIILFTVLTRLLMWPLIKKQLHHAKVMRDLQPELKRVKQAAAGNKQQESLMVMELYKEKGVNPFSSIGILLVQLPILIGLYSGIRRVLSDPHALVDFAYPFVQSIDWMKHLAANIGAFDGSLFGIVDLTRPAIGKAGVYLPAMVIVIGSAIAQYFQSQQLMPQQANARKLRHILREAGSGGQQADQGEVSAAMNRNMRYFLPGLIFLFTVQIASALSLYFLVSGLVAMFQQRKVLKRDETELVAAADKTTSKNIIEGEVINRPSQKSKKASRKNRRRR